MSLYSGLPTKDIPKNYILDHDIQVSVRNEQSIEAYFKPIA